MVKTSDARCARSHEVKLREPVISSCGVGVDMVRSYRRGWLRARRFARGATVEDRPVSGVDFMATICLILGIDPNQSNHAGPRPVRVVDRGANPIRELIG